jgi:hypothetical protein
MNQLKRPLLGVAILLALGLACNASSDQQATVQALGESVSGTATAAAAEGLAMEGLVQTAAAQATAQLESIQATVQAELGISAQEQSATATAAAPLLAKLPQYGVDPGQGELAWIHPPLTLEVSGYLQSDFQNRFMGTVARDFVVSTDITWNTTTGLSGCGFVFRSDGNEDAPNQYVGLISRGGNGRAVFQSMVDGDPRNAVDMYAFGKDPQFQWQNDTTNNLTIVGRGNVFTFFTNGTMVGEVEAGDPPPPPSLPDPPEEPPDDAPPEAAEEYQQALQEHEDMVDQIQESYQAQAGAYRQDTPYFDRGFIAMVAISESGRTVCQFDNTWLWLFDV